MWELSSFSEAAMAAVLLALMLAEPPLSQPRWGSTAPTGFIGVCGICVLERGRPAANMLCQLAQNNVGAVEPQRGCDGGGMAGLDAG